MSESLENTLKACEYAIPLSNFESRLKELLELGQLVLSFCSTGTTRSGIASMLLTEQGVPTAYVPGGIKAVIKSERWLYSEDDLIRNIFRCQSLVVLLDNKDPLKLYAPFIQRVQKHDDFIMRTSEAEVLKVFMKRGRLNSARSAR